MKKRKPAKRFSEENENKIVTVISTVIILLALLGLASYYFNTYTRVTDVVIILLALLLTIDSLLYIQHTGKYKKSYIFLSGLFFLVALAHAPRFFFGPLHCSLGSRLGSIYTYEGLAFLVGLALLSLSIYLMKKHSGSKYHRIAGILFGTTMVINHVIKLSIGKCV